MQVKWHIYEIAFMMTHYSNYMTIEIKSDVLDLHATSERLKPYMCTPFRYTHILYDRSDMDCTISYTKAIVFI